jgi:hypothetical protein
MDLDLAETMAFLLTLTQEVLLLTEIMGLDLAETMASDQHLLGETH